MNKYMNVDRLMLALRKQDRRGTCRPETRKELAMPVPCIPVGAPPFTLMEPVYGGVPTLSRVVP
jgi:hypothetical protein